LSFVVIGLGELLWDVFPDGKQLGGAPINFAFIASQLGAEAYPVSCIGKDSQGMALRNALSDLYIDHSYIQKDDQKPTGTVQIVLDQAGIPSYEIRNEVAWDAIRFTEELKQLAKRTSAVCFGSLTQRSDFSQKTIYDFLKNIPQLLLKNQRFQ
jgi:fructokinase